MVQESRTLELKGNDVALIMSETGKCVLNTPVMSPDDICPGNLLLFTTLHYRLADPKFVNELLDWFDEKINKVREGVNMDRQESQDSLDSVSEPTPPPKQRA